MSSIWLAQLDLENAATPAMVTAIYDDGNTGALNTAAIAADIDRGEQEVLSWLGDEYGPPPFTGAILTQLSADPFLKYAALDYALAYMFDRHPEYPQGATDAKERSWRFQRADQRMQRVLSGRQRPTTMTTPPANVGGVVVDNAPRIISDSPDGTYNGGDL